MNDSFTINKKQMIKIAQKRKTVKSEKYAWEIKPPFMIYRNFEVCYNQKIM